MDTEYSTPFSKAILTALFAGIAATIICLAYDVIFRLKTSFALSDLINVSTIIFLVNLVFLVFGFLYYGCIKAFKRGEIFYVVLLLLLTAFSVIKSFMVHRSSNPEWNTDFRQ